MENSKYLLIFRRGMALRKWILEEIFPDKEYLEFMRDGLIEVSNGYYKGTEPLKREIDVLNLELNEFKLTSFANLSNVYKNDLTIIYTGRELKEQKVDIGLAIMSGYLKVDSRGFYFTKNELKRMEWRKNVL